MSRIMLRSQAGTPARLSIMRGASVTKRSDKETPPLQPQEVQLLRQMCMHALPIAAIAYVLKVSDSVVARARAYYDLVSEKGSSIPLNTVYKVTAQDLPALYEQQRVRFERLREKYVREAAVTYSREEWVDDDLHPVDAIRAYRLLVPSGVLQEFLGFNEKTFARITKALGLGLTASVRASLTRIAHDESLTPDLSLLSERQQRRMMRILNHCRKEYRRQAKKRMDANADILWNTLLGQRSKATGKSIQCRGKHCKTRAGDDKWKWPRTKVFFYSTTDTKDRLGHFCKYCQLKKNQLRQRKTPSTRRPLVSTAYTKSLVVVFQEMNDQVPAIYLKELFGLTPKQYQRLRVLAKLPTEFGKGQHRLNNWRALTEDRFPIYTSLSKAGMDSLRQIWRRDVAQWKKALEVEEQMLLDAMKTEDQAIEAKHRAMQVNRTSADPLPTRRACPGGCGKSWHVTPLTFPPTYRRLRGQCRFCINRALRKQPGSI